MKRSVVELTNGKPPYQWRHGWIPLTANARLIKAKKRRQSGGARIGPSAVQRRLFEDKSASVLDDPDPQLEAEFDRVARSSKAKLGPKDRDALLAYFEESTAVNEHLRDPRSWDYEETKATAKRLNEVVARSGVGQDIVVYRGLNLDRSVGFKFQPGDVFSDKGFSSTSYNPLIAREFAGGNSRDRKAVQLEIRVPKGSKALIVPSDTFGDSYRQGEVLFGSGQRFRVVGVTDTGTIQLEVLSGD